MDERASSAMGVNLSRQRLVSFCSDGVTATETENQLFSQLFLDRILFCPRASYHRFNIMKDPSVYYDFSVFMI